MGHREPKRRDREARSGPSTHFDVVTSRNFSEPVDGLDCAWLADTSCVVRGPLEAEIHMETAGNCGRYVADGRVRGLAVRACRVRHYAHTGCAVGPVDSYGGPAKRSGNRDGRPRGAASGRRFRFPLIRCQAAAHFGNAPGNELALDGPVPSWPQARRQAGSEAARQRRCLRCVLDEHLPTVWRLLCRMGLDETDAADAVQEVMVVSADKLKSTNACSQRQFLLRTAYRVGARLRARRRSLGDWALSQVADPVPHPDALLDQKRARELLDDILGRLSVEQRTVFTLHDIEGLTMAEIAQLLGISSGTIASRLRLARQRFNKCVARIEARMRARGGGAR